MSDQKQEEGDQKTGKAKHLVWLAVGIGAGAGIGVAMDNIAVGFGIGTAVGALLSVTMRMRDQGKR